MTNHGFRYVESGPSVGRKLIVTVQQIGKRVPSRNLFLGFSHFLYQYVLVAQFLYRARDNSQILNPNPRFPQSADNRLIPIKFVCAVLPARIVTFSTKN